MTNWPRLKQAAEYLKMGKSTVYQLVREQYRHGGVVRKKAMRVMRKPYGTTTFGNIDAKPLKSHGLSECGVGVLSGSKTRMRVYLETI